MTEVAYALSLITFAVACAAWTYCALTKSLLKRLDKAFADFMEKTDNRFDTLEAYCGDNNDAQLTAASMGMIHYGSNLTQQIDKGRDIAEENRKFARNSILELHNLMDELANACGYVFIPEDTTTKPAHWGRRMVVTTPVVPTAEGAMFPDSSDAVADKETPDAEE